MTSEYGSPEDKDDGSWAVVVALAVATAAGIIGLFLYMNTTAQQAQDVCTAKDGTIVSRGLCVSPDGRILP